MYVYLVSIVRAFLLRGKTVKAKRAALVKGSRLTPGSYLNSSARVTRVLMGGCCPMLGF